jgi:endonuclease YncB( thermonuclease family)
MIDAMSLRPLLLKAALCAAGLAVAACSAAAGHTAPTPAPGTGLIQGVVVQVSAGNSLLLSPSGRPPIAVRLRDIDVPLGCQPGAEASRQALTELALNKAATLHPLGRDAGGRTVGAVTVDHVDLAVRMVEDGQAFSIRTRWDQGPLVKQERMARGLGRGLHAQGEVVLPSEFRRNNGPCPAAPTAAGGG